MSALEPGEKFTITYGKAAKPLDVIALSGRQKRRALQCMASTMEAKRPDAVLAALEELEAVVKICSPGITEEVLDTLDDTMQVNIITATLMQARLSEGEEKKSE